MSKLSRGGIAYDLELTPYIFIANYENGDNYTYMFSSQYYLTKFINTLEEHRDKITESLSKRFGFEISNNLLSDIRLYMTVEKRGFFIIKNNEEKITCPNIIKLDGMTMTIKS